MTLLRLILRGSAVLGALAGLLCFVRADAQAVEHLTLERAAPIYMNCPNLTSASHTPAKGNSWIEVLSFNFGATSSRSYSTGAGAGKAASAPSIHEIVVTKTTDSATPNLMRAAATGQHVKSCTVDLDKPVRNGNQEYLSFTMEDVIVTSVHLLGRSGDINPQEQVSFSFQKIEYSYKPEQSNGAKATTVAPGLLLVKPSPSPTPSPMKTPVIH
jgi:type VI secretion system secreted protein Hcp